MDSSMAVVMLEPFRKVTTRHPNLQQGESGSEKGRLRKRGLFREVHFLEIPENLEEILEILEKTA